MEKKGFRLRRSTLELGRSSIGLHRGCPAPEPHSPADVDTVFRGKEILMTFRQRPVEEQVVVITGASSGIGLATARLFASRGVKGLVLVARNEEALRKVAQEFEGQGVHTIPAPADASRQEDLE